MMVSAVISGVVSSVVTTVTMAVEITVLAEAVMMVVLSSLGDYGMLVVVACGS